jgi:hypothetical protein
VAFHGPEQQNTFGPSLRTSIHFYFTISKTTPWNSQFLFTGRLHSETTMWSEMRSLMLRAQTEISGFFSMTKSAMSNPWAVLMTKTERSEDVPVSHYHSDVIKPAREAFRSESLQTLLTITSIPFLLRKQLPIGDLCKPLKETSHFTISHKRGDLIRQTSDDRKRE